MSGRDLMRPEVPVISDTPIPTLTPETRQAAAVTVCANARNLPDALLLLAMLGLDARLGVQ